MHPIIHNKGKDPIVLNDVDTPVDDEFSSGSTPSMSFSPAKNTRAKLRKRPVIALSSVIPLVDDWDESCISVKFSVFFITKMHYSQSFSLILR